MNNSDLLVGIRELPGERKVLLKSCGEETGVTVTNVLHPAVARFLASQLLLAAHEIARRNGEMK